MAHRMVNRRSFLAASGAAVAGAALTACGGGSGNETENETGGPTGGAGGGPSAGASPTAPGATGMSAGGTSAASGGASSGGGGGVTPAYVPYTGVKPDLPAGDHGVPAGFYHYPDNPKQFTSGIPGHGGKVSCLIQGSAPPTALNKNRWWQALNKALGVTIETQGVPSQAYLAKFQVDLAGSDFPDIVLFPRISNTLDILEHSFADLTPYLSGDNIKNYPGLASIPTASWQIPTINGRIWGMPQSRPNAGQVAYYRGDVLQKIGLDPASVKIESGQDFMDFCKEATNIKKGVYAMGTPPVGWIDLWILEMMGAPNGWAVQDGKFTSVNESPQFPEMLNQLTTIWKNGWCNPDMFAHPDSDLTYWNGGRTSMYLASVVALTGTLGNPTYNAAAVPPPKWEGGGLATKQLGTAGYYAFASIPKASDSRVKELLDICNWFASPFGTTEYLLFNYGVEGVDYTLDGTDPKATDTAKGESLNGLIYVCSQRFVDLYSPGQPEGVKGTHSYLEKVLPDSVGDASWGLYSPTALSKAEAANKALGEVEGSIIQGRKPVSAWADALKSWQKTAGNAMRDEYEKAYAALHS